MRISCVPEENLLLAGLGEPSSIVETPAGGPRPMIILLLVILNLRGAALKVESILKPVARRYLQSITSNNYIRYF